MAAIDRRISVMQSKMASSGIEERLRLEREIFAARVERQNVIDTAVTGEDDDGEDNDDNNADAAPQPQNDVESNAFLNDFTVGLCDEDFSQFIDTMQV